MTNRQRLIRLSPVEARFSTEGRSCAAPKSLLARVQLAGDIARRRTGEAMTYEANGRQYIVIMAGGHHFMKTPVGDALVAYALAQRQ
ncbi:MAG: hypothetical protein WAU68_14790 [Vitreimonas sp.]